MLLHAMPREPLGPPPFGCSRNPPIFPRSSAPCVRRASPPPAASATSESVPRDKCRETPLRKSAAPLSLPPLALASSAPLPAIARARFPKYLCPLSTPHPSRAPSPAARKNCSPSIRTIRASRLPEFFAHHISSTPHAASLPRCCVVPSQAATLPLSPSRLSALASNSARATPFSCNPLPAIPATTHSRPQFPPTFHRSASFAPHSLYVRSSLKGTKYLSRIVWLAD